jgi:phage protein Gp37/Gp68
MRRVPAAIRFLSVEPLLGPLPSPDLTGLDWVIVGGESRPHHRPLDLDWVRDLPDRCVDLRIPLFFKQGGGPTPRAGGACSTGEHGTSSLSHTRLFKAMVLARITEPTGKLDSLCVLEEADTKGTDLFATVNEGRVCMPKDARTLGVGACASGQRGRGRCWARAWA